MEQPVVITAILRERIHPTEVEQLSEMLKVQY